MKSEWAIGLMTGTVLDGNIDVAMIRTDGETVDEFGPYALMPYPDGLRDLLFRTFDAAGAWGFEGPEPAIFREAEIALTKAQSDAVNAFLADHRLKASEISAVGFHGQTVLHAGPREGKRGNTRQLGDGAMMAEIVGTDVVFDFRSADVAAGGQGAPLAPVYHRALLKRIGAGPETAILNLGGVANITWCDGEEMVACDTGPANAPVNDWVRRHTGADMDVDGRIAASGTVNETRLNELLQHPYLTAPFPKSLDRFSFLAEMAEGETLENGAALLTAFSAAAVGRALDLLPNRPTRLVVCGGGRRNPTLMREIDKRTGTAAVAAEDVGLRGDAVEAECFAFLAVRSKLGLPLSFPTTTGVSQPMQGGVLAPAVTA